ncbi:MAG: glycine cleavage T C-terminal barrel domain-containing protein [Elusimicrobiota bacterium]
MDKTSSAVWSALRYGAGYLRLADIGVLVIRGADRKEFLHGLLSNDIASLGVGQGVKVCILTSKGKIAGDFSVYNRGSDYLVIGCKAGVTATAAALAKYLSVALTMIEDATAQSPVLCVAGPKAGRLLAGLIPGSGAIAHYGRVKVAWRGFEVEVLSYPEISREALLVVARPPVLGQFYDELAGVAKDQGASALPEIAVDMLRIESGIGHFGKDYGVDAFPQEVGLERAVCFTKGCYMGQEYMSRIKHFGDTKRLLVGLVIGKEMNLPRAVMHEGREVGQATSIVYSQALDAFLALAVLPKELAVGAGKFSLASGEGKIEARVVKFPIEDTAR